MRTTYKYRKVQQQFQRQEAKVLQLQQVQPYGQGVLEEEGKRNEKIFQMQ